MLVEVEFPETALRWGCWSHRFSRRRWSPPVCVGTDSAPHECLLLRCLRSEGDNVFGAGGERLFPMGGKPDWPRGGRWITVLVDSGGRFHGQEGLDRQGEHHPRPAHERTACPHCGHPVRVDSINLGTVHTLSGLTRLNLLVPLLSHRGLDVIALIGRLCYREYRSVPRSASLWSAAVLPCPSGPSPTCSNATTNSSP